LSMFFNFLHIFFLVFFFCFFVRWFWFVVN
jgi:hypothetical protein